jgi:hypothetical protein
VELGPHALALSRTCALARSRTRWHHQIYESVEWLKVWNCATMDKSSRESARESAVSPVSRVDKASRELHLMIAENNKYGVAGALDRHPECINMFSTDLNYDDAFNISKALREDGSRNAFTWIS